MSVTSAKGLKWWIFLKDFWKIGKVSLERWHFNRHSKKVRRWTTQVSGGKHPKLKGQVVQNPRGRGKQGGQCASWRQSKGSIVRGELQGVWGCMRAKGQIIRYICILFQINGRPLENVSRAVIWCFERIPWTTGKKRNYYISCELKKGGRETS